MSVLNFFKRVSFYPKSLILRWKILVARRLLLSNHPQQWYALDNLGIYGFGTDLLRIDFLPKKNPQPLWGYESQPNRALYDLLNADISDQIQLLKSIVELTKDYTQWSEKEDEENPNLPWRINEFLLPFDAVSLYGIIQYLRPKKYIEIGSGMSTRVACLAKSKGNIPMEMISIDPEPRLSIAQLCDQVYRVRLEDFNCDEFLSLVTPDTLIFFDGSHRVFPSSDVTVFFLTLLPNLPKGCIVHIHDIYLPNDYPPELQNRLWSEHYLLAAYLLGGSKHLQVLLPCAHLASNQIAKELFAESFAIKEFPGCSFWLKIV
ncbi:class I SAM-dependent methyltransferase [Dolichospermum planctonicum]|uniref:Class I SAM-dependent methyltransferase n=1 Tax=Dolichospermum planctonicum TaxID=136072 RepID=A0A480AHM6_9CYAN|nr:class I SAM-dependent methyltransferase [Dolichospermum planctonicum]GCL42778.1 hypothetical protein NIES80_24860 [Dolichospermum planctonicum]